MTRTFVHLGAGRKRSVALEIYQGGSRLSTYGCDDAGDDDDDNLNLSIKTIGTGAKYALYIVTKDPFLHLV